MADTCAVGRTATVDEVKGIIGEEKLHVLEDICRIAPTVAEVCEAMGCLEANAAASAVIENAMNPRTKKVYTLLKRVERVRQDSCCGGCH